MNNDQARELSKAASRVRATEQNLYNACAAPNDDTPGREDLPARAGDAYVDATTELRALEARLGMSVGAGAGLAPVEDLPGASPPADAPQKSSAPVPEGDGGPTAS